MGSLALAGCSLQGLDRFYFPECTSGTTDRIAACAALNTRDHVMPSACDVWQCNDSGSCTFGHRDADGDDHVAATCGGDDCQDGDALVHPGLTESCDGADNDCNGVVDDLTTALASPLASQVVLPDMGSIASASFAPRSDGVLVSLRRGTAARVAVVDDLDTATELPLEGETTARPYATGQPDGTTQPGCADGSSTHNFATLCGAGDTCAGSQVCVVRGTDGAHICEPIVVARRAGRPALGGPVCTAHWQCDDGIFCNGAETCSPDDADSNIDPNTGCRGQTTDHMQRQPCGASAICFENADACVSHSVSPCVFQSLDAAPLGIGDEFLAVARTGRCSVRPGLVDVAEAQPQLAFIGGYQFSSVWRGIDGGDPVADCPASAVSALSIAALASAPSRDFSTGLVAYREALDDGSSASIAVLGLWREQSTIAQRTVRYVNGSDEGVPVELSAPTTGRPHTTSFTNGPAGGYLVAYPRTGGGVTVAAFAALGLPSCSTTTPPTCSFGPGADGTPQTGVTFVAPVAPNEIFYRRETPALATPVEQSLVTSMTDVGADVLVAAGVERTTSSTELAFAWATPSSVVVLLASIDPSSLAITPSGDPIVISVAAGAPTGLTLHHVESGISVPGTFGAEVIAADETGGYVLTWTAGAATWAVRISDHTHEAIGMPVRLGSASVEAAGYVDYDAGNPRVRVIAHQGNEVVVFPSVCGPTS